MIIKVYSITNYIYYLFKLEICLYVVHALE